MNEMENKLVSKYVHKAVFELLDIYNTASDLWCVTVMHRANVSATHRT